MQKFLKRYNTSIPRIMYQYRINKYCKNLPIYSKIVETHWLTEQQIAILLNKEYWLSEILEWNWIPTNNWIEFIPKSKVIIIG